jgi:hypothetical protein
MASRATHCFGNICTGAPRACPPFPHRPGKPPQRAIIMCGQQPQRPRQRTRKGGLRNHHQPRRQRPSPVQGGLVSVAPRRMPLIEQMAPPIPVRQPSILFSPTACRGSVQAGAWVRRRAEPDWHYRHLAGHHQLAQAACALERRTSARGVWHSRFRCRCWPRQHRQLLAPSTEDVRPKPTVIQKQARWPARRASGLSLLVGRFP